MAYRVLIESGASAVVESVATAAAPGVVGAHCLANGSPDDILHAFAGIRGWPRAGWSEDVAASLLRVSQAARREELATPEFTFAAVEIDGSKASVSWCGDVRVYVVRKSRPALFTRDHVNKFATDEELGADAASLRELSSMYTRWISAAQPFQPDSLTWEISQPDDRLVICSGGYHQHRDPLEHALELGSGTVTREAVGDRDFIVRLEPA